MSRRRLHCKSDTGFFLGYKQVIALYLQNIGLQVLLSTTPISKILRSDVIKMNGKVVMRENLHCSQFQPAHCKIAVWCNAAVGASKEWSNFRYLGPETADFTFLFSWTDSESGPATWQKSSQDLPVAIISASRSPSTWKILDHQMSPSCPISIAALLVPVQLFTERDW